MQALGTEKTRKASGLLLALVASTLMLGACGDGIFFSSEGPSTTAAATDTNSSAAPTPTPTPGSTAATTATETTPVAGGATPTPSGGTTPTPTPPPPAGGGATPPPPAPAPGPSAAAVAGKASYSACIGCHGANPSNNQAKILNAKNASTTLSAIANNTGGMGFLKASIGSTEASNIAAYVSAPF
jgi:mono/diheme cytochrome c family protein